MRTLLLLLFLWVSPALLPPPAGAAAVAPDTVAQTIEIEADRLEAENQQRRVTFFGNVVARHADMVIYADRLTVIYGAEQRTLDEVVASGHVRVVRGDQVATSDQARFDALAQTILLKGSPKVRQGESFIEGAEITIFLKEGRSLVKSADGSRVNAFFTSPPPAERKP